MNLFPAFGVSCWLCMSPFNYDILPALIECLKCRFTSTHAVVFQVGTHGTSVLPRPAIRLLTHLATVVQFTLVIGTVVCMFVATWTLYLPDNIKGYQREYVSLTRSDLLMGAVLSCCETPKIFFFLLNQLFCLPSPPFGLLSRSSRKFFDYIGEQCLKKYIVLRAEVSRCP